MSVTLQGADINGIQKSNLNNLLVAMKDGWKEELMALVVQGKTGRDLTPWSQFHGGNLYDYLYADGENSAQQPACRLTNDYHSDCNV